MTLWQGVGKVDQMELRWSAHVAQQEITFAGCSKRSSGKAAGVGGLRSTSRLRLSEQDFHRLSLSLTRNLSITLAAASASF